MTLTTLEPIQTQHATSPAPASMSLLSTPPYQPKAPSALLLLPAEIRNAIYELLLTSHLTPRERRLPSTNDPSSPIQFTSELCPALLRTSRQLHAEALPFLYAYNTFTASPTLLTSLPFLLHPGRPVSCPGVSARIRRWYINVRLDCDARFTAAQTEAAFSGAEELEVEASQAMYRAADNGVLMLFAGVRGVGKARVHGSVDHDVARWLEMAMETPAGEVVEAYQDSRAEMYDAWSHGNR